MGFKIAVQRGFQVVRKDGVPGLVAKVAQRAYRGLGDPSENLHLLPEHVMDATRVQRQWALPEFESEKPLTVGWLISGPAEGSGGHTTIFRMIEALEAAGHRCVIYVYDGVSGRADRYVGIIRRWWPNVGAEVHDFSGGLRGCDAYVATAWQTAHVLACHQTLIGARIYMAQDYEPFFYPRGAAYDFAAESYDFGFATVTIGEMVANELRLRHQLSPVVAPFGCDTSAYHPTSDQPRSGIVFYSKPGVARRGYELGILALRLFHQRRPEIPIHAFGIRAKNLPFDATVHAHMTPTELNKLYNKCSAGLALSFTNISLIATELMAAGVFPVVNDHKGSRADLDNEFVVWTRPTPVATAEALIRAHEAHQTNGPRRIAESVASLSWEPARKVLVRTIENACRGGEFA